MLGGLNNALMLRFWLVNEIYMHGIVCGHLRNSHCLKSNSSLVHFSSTTTTERNGVVTLLKKIIKVDAV